MNIFIFYFILKYIFTKSHLSYVLITCTPEKKQIHPLKKVLHSLTGFYAYQTTSLLASLLYFTF